MNVLGKPWLCCTLCAAYQICSQQNIWNHVMWCWLNRCSMLIKHWWCQLYYVVLLPCDLEEAWSFQTTCLIMCKNRPQGHPRWPNISIEHIFTKANARYQIYVIFKRTKSVSVYSTIVVIAPDYDWLRVLKPKRWCNTYIHTYIHFSTGRSSFKNNWTI